MSSSNNRSPTHHMGRTHSINSFITTLVVEPLTPKLLPKLLELYQILQKNCHLFNGPPIFWIQLHAPQTQKLQVMAKEMMRLHHPIQIEDIVKHLPQTVQIEGTMRVVLALTHQVLDVRTFL